MVFEQTENCGFISAMGDGMTCPYPSPLQDSSTLSNTKESALNENLPSPWSDGGAILESTDFPPVPPTIGSSGKNIREKQTKGIINHNQLFFPIVEQFSHFQFHIIN